MSIQVVNDGISHHVTHVMLMPGSRGQVADSTFTPEVGSGDNWQSVGEAMY